MPPTPPAPSLVHLADLLDEAVVETSPAPNPEERFWSFDEPRPEWSKADSELEPRLASITLEALDDGVRLELGPPRAPAFMRMGGLQADVGELRFEDWKHLQVKARSSDRLAGLTAVANLDEEGAMPSFWRFLMSPDASAPVFNDGSVQTYSLPLEPLEGQEGKALRNVAIFFGAPSLARVDVLSIRLVPRGAAFDKDAGALAVTRDGSTRTSLYAHTPAALTFSLTLPEEARFDFGLTVSPGETMTYRVRAEAEEGAVLNFEQTVESADAWNQHRLDLSAFGGRKVGLVLEAESEQPGAVAQWGAPIVSGKPSTEASEDQRPNVIFYVIDGGDADLMSLYGYERETTPFLEELAAEAVVFTRAYSNSTWTQPSTVSFMTSLQHSVLGGLRRGIHSTPVPRDAVTMVEHFRRGGYQTVALTANPNAGRLIGLDRGIDLMRDVGTAHHSNASVELQERYWRFREEYPGGPTWVHFQSTDVHEPNEPEEPFAGRLVSAADRGRLKGLDARIFTAAGRYFGATSMIDFYRRGLTDAGIDRHDYFGIKKGLYDETMMHQDHSLEALVAELKRRGEWEKTLLVIASDHGHPAATYSPFGRGLLDPEPDLWQGALFDAYATRVPLIFVWPGKLEGGAPDRDAGVDDRCPADVARSDRVAAAGGPPGTLSGAALAR